jgi:hypothetical protein
LRQRLRLAWFLLHFFLIAAVCGRDTLSLIARGFTIIPPGARRYADRAEAFIAALFGQNLPSLNPVRQTVTTYLNLAGIERGYGYFAPNVPASYKLIFELHYPDGRLAYELPRVSSRAARLRVTGLLDEIGRTRHAALREYLVKQLAAATWREHPELTSVRAIFGAILLPTMTEFEQGKRESYQFLYAYDFSRSD